MKRVIAPLILFVGALLATQLLQKYTFIYQELDGLFLWTDDYFAQMHQESFAIAGIIGDYLTQFFRYRFMAAGIVGVEVLLVFLMARRILSRVHLGWDVLAALCACLYWLAIAFAPTAKTGVAVLLILLPVWLLSLFFRRRENWPLKKEWIEWAGTAALTVTVILVLALHPAVSRRERTAALRTGVATGNWDLVLRVATDDAIREDRSMLPFAMMALGMKGQLGNKIFDYDVRCEDDFDMCDQEDSYISLFFKAFLYEHLQCPNEAVHNFFQLTTVQPHGQSFLVLRQLVAEYYRMGDFALARKYLAILSKSSCHRDFVRTYEALMAQGTPREADSLAFRRTVPLIHHDPFKNLFVLNENGIRTPFLIDRVLCTMLIREEWDKFRSLFLTVRDLYPAVPKYYRQAFELQYQ